MLKGDPDGLIAFLMARLDEDETAAKLAAREGCAWTQGDPGQGSCAITSLGGTVVYDEGSPDEYQAAHIARHDPARVLREVEAKRAIVAAYEWTAARKADGGGIENNYNFRSGQVNALETAIQCLAAAWSDHPDYRADWKP